MPSGRPKWRATSVEQTVAQVCREAKARVQTNVLLRDMNIAVPAADERRVEVLAAGLPIHGGAQLAIDVTLRTVLTRDGAPRPQTDWKDGVVSQKARRDKEEKYPELADGARCRLVVLAMETGGRFSEELANFIAQLAQAKAQAAPSYLRSSAARAFERRWCRMLAVSAVTAHVRSLVLDRNSSDRGIHIHRPPWLQNLLTEARWGEPNAELVAESR